jgi:hypothetical protein
MGARVKRISILLALTLLAPNLANAATPSPSKSPSKSISKSPTPTVKASAKPTASSKVTIKPTVKATATAKKKVVYKPRPKVSLSPSPSPKWPPIGFQSDKSTPDIYAKFPSRKELIGFTTPSTKTADLLRQQLQTCEIYICGALLAASVAGCNWWEFNTDVFGPVSDTDNTEIKYGSITALYGASAPKVVSVYLLISKELIKPNYRTSKIQIACHREPIPTDLQVPSNTYLPNK